MNYKKPELLIPASSLEVLRTAVMFGADAVYIGGEAFGSVRAGHARPLRGGVNELRAKARPTECGKVGCRAACPQYPGT